MPSGTEFLGLVAALGGLAAVDRRARLATLAAIAGATVLDADKPAMYFWGRNPFPLAVRTDPLLGTERVAERDAQRNRVRPVVCAR